MTTSASMKPPKLSRAQRTMLHNAVDGRALGVSLTRNSTASKANSTVHATRSTAWACSLALSTSPRRLAAPTSVPKNQKAPQGA
ncbi:hypothetical protein [Comamonas fluminis]|uniref:hypothetical protein n=1 Tax=Comamonas fluminis TaxID=2796366 RepID=UPI001C459663|nr:hypothetical protein [Comamonas fluminis]